MEAFWHGASDQTHEKSEHMKSVVLQAPERLEIQEIPEPSAPGPGEALVQVVRIGVCGTDYHAWRGKQPFFSYPRLPGHELGVEVLQTGAEVETVSPGQICAVEPYLNCGKCLACRKGKTNCCTSLQVLGVHCEGGMCERLLVPARKLYPSDKLNVEQLALVETLCIGAHAVRRASIEKGEFALIAGAGPIGLAVAQCAQMAGARVIVTDISRNRLEFCSSLLNDGIMLPAEEAEEELKRITQGDGPLLVMDATGSMESMQASLARVASGGRMVCVGLFQGNFSFSDPEFHRREITLLASRNAVPQDFHTVMNALEQGTLKVDKWITHRAPLQNAPHMIPQWAAPNSGVIKALITNG